MLKISSTVWQTAVRVMLAFVCASAASIAVAQAPKVLIIGDVNVKGGFASKIYADAAYNEMIAAVPAANVTRKNFDITGAGGNPTTITSSDFIASDGGRYDIVVLTAVFGGFNSASVSALQSAIQTRAAHAFFLYPDQCTLCAPNIDQITVPTINAATGWSISTGVLFNNSSNSQPGTVVLNNATPLANSFSSLNPMAVLNYRALNNIPAYNVLYMPPQTPSPGDPSPRPIIQVITSADVTNNTRIDNVSALIVPRAQSFDGKGACIFTISDVNPLTQPGNPPVGTLGKIMVDAAMSPTGSCAAQSGSIKISKTLVLPVGQPSVAPPLNFQFTATCDKPAANTNYTVPSLAFSTPGTQTTTVTDIPAGANCNVAEQSPVPIPNFRWDIAPSSPIGMLIAEGGQSSAAFTNTLIPTTGNIAITKTLAPLPMSALVAWPQTFGFTATCNLPTAGSTYTGNVDFSAAGTQTATIANVPDGALCSLSETLPTEPVAHAWDPPVFSPASVTVTAGQTASSAITNRLQIIPAHLTLVKNVSNLYGGTKAKGDFTLKATNAGSVDVINATGDSPDLVNVAVAPGTYKLSEANVVGYTASNWNCSGGQLTGSDLTLASGQNVSCMITNTDTGNAAHLTLVKNVNNLYGGTKAKGDFTLKATNASSVDVINAVGDSPDLVNVAVAPGTYKLSEANVAGYTASGWNCSGGQLTGSDLTLASGQNVSCTITNTDTGSKPVPVPVDSRTTLLLLGLLLIGGAAGYTRKQRL